jgi:hypothetical protein
MKQITKSIFWAVLVVSITGLMASCASSPKFDESQASTLQRALNTIAGQFPIPIAGKKVVVKFAGNLWQATLDGKKFLLGSCVFAETADGATITLKQTHVYSDKQKPGIGGDVGWVKTPGPQIELEYKKGPPETLSAK